MATRTSTLPKKSSTTGFLRHRPGGLFTVWHEHNGGQLIWSPSGVQMAHTDSSTWTAPPEYAIWIAANCFHRNVSRGNALEHSLYFSAEVSHSLPSATGLIKMTAPLHRAIKDTLEDLESGETDCRSRGVFERELRRVVGLATPNPFPREELLFALVETIIPNLAEQRTQKEWAELLQMNVLDLNTLLRKSTTMSFKEWQHQITLLRAVGLLAEGCSVGNVAKEVGYSQTTHFIKAFSSKFGNTPRRFFEVPSFCRPDKLHRKSRRLQLSQPEKSISNGAFSTDAASAEGKRRKVSSISTFSDTPNSGYFYSLHQHQCGELVWSPAGVLSVSTKEGIWMASPKRAVWIPAATEHEVLQSKGAHLHCFFIESPDSLALSSRPHLMSVTSDVKDMMLSLCKAESGVQPCRKNDLLFLSSILDEGSTPLSIPLTRSSDTCLAPLVATLRQTPSNRISLRVWARHLGLSPRTLARVAHQQFGVSFGKYCRMMCMRFAAERLLQGDSVAQVASLLDYKSVSKFGVMFSRISGQLPSQYGR